MISTAWQLREWGMAMTSSTGEPDESSLANKDKRHGSTLSVPRITLASLSRSGLHGIRAAKCETADRLGLSPQGQTTAPAVFSLDERGCRHTDTVGRREANDTPDIALLDRPLNRGALADRSISTDYTLFL